MFGLPALAEPYELDRFVHGRRGWNLPQIEELVGAQAECRPDRRGKTSDRSIRYMIEPPVEGGPVTEHSVDELQCQRSITNVQTSTAEAAIQRVNGEHFRTLDRQQGFKRYPSGAASRVTRTE